MDVQDGNRPLIVGIGGSNRRASLTDQLLRTALAEAAALGARTALFGGAFLAGLPVFDADEQRGGEDPASSWSGGGPRGRPADRHPGVPRRYVRSGEERTRSSGAAPQRRSALSGRQGSRRRDHGRRLAGCRDHSGRPALGDPRAAWVADAVRGDGQFGRARVRPRRRADRASSRCPAHRRDAGRRFRPWRRSAVGYPEGDPGGTSSRARSTARQRRRRMHPRASAICRASAETTPSCSHSAVAPTSTACPATSAASRAGRNNRPSEAGPRPRLHQRARGYVRTPNLDPHLGLTGTMCEPEHCI